MKKFKGKCKYTIYVEYYPELDIRIFVKDKNTDILKTFLNIPEFKQSFKDKSFEPIFKDCELLMSNKKYTKHCYQIFI